MREILYIFRKIVHKRSTNYNLPEAQLIAHVARQTLTLALLPPMHPSSVPPPAHCSMASGSRARPPPWPGYPRPAAYAGHRSLPMRAWCAIGRPPVRHGREGGRRCKHSMIPTFLNNVATFCKMLIKNS
jgi:hypothetical protein